MSANSLYGKLVADLAQDYQRQCDALHKNPQLINRFGDAVRPFSLTPNVKPSGDGTVTLCATSSRGEDHTALLAAMREHGFLIALPQRMARQFDDGFVMWTASVRIDTLKFSLLFYIPVDLA